LTLRAAGTSSTPPHPLPPPCSITCGTTGSGQPPRWVLRNASSFGELSCWQEGCLTVSTAHPQYPQYSQWKGGGPGSTSFGALLPSLLMQCVYTGGRGQAELHPAIHPPRQGVCWGFWAFPPVPYRRGAQGLAVSPFLPTHSLHMRIYHQPTPCCFALKKHAGSRVKCAGISAQAASGPALPFSPPLLPCPLCLALPCMRLMQ